MDSEFEPAVRTEETQEARIAIVDLPGFRKEDLRVQINQEGNIVILGERGVKEIEETPKVTERLEKMKGGGVRFRKVMTAPENLNYNGITAMFSNERLRISLPLLRISDQRIQGGAVPTSGKPDQSVQSKVEWTKRSEVEEDNQRARSQEAIRRDDDKEKGSTSVEESKGLVENRTTEAPKHAQDLVHEEPSISKLKATQELRYDDQSARRPELFPPYGTKAKTVGAAGELKETAEVPKHTQDFVGGAPTSKDRTQERSAVGKVEQSAAHPEVLRPNDQKAKLVGAAGELKELIEGKKADAAKHPQDLVGGAPISKDSTQERSAVAKVEQSATHPEALRPIDLKAKLVGAAGELKALIEGKKADAPKPAQDFVGGAAISKDSAQERSAVAKVEQSATHPEALRPIDLKAKLVGAAGELKELIEGKKTDAPKPAQDSVGGAAISKDSTQERSAVAKVEQSATHRELVGGKKGAEIPKHDQEIVRGGAGKAEKVTQEQSAVAQNDQNAMNPTFIRHDDLKDKSIAAAAGKSEKLVEDKEKEAKHAEDPVHGELPIPFHPQAQTASADARYGDQNQSVNPKLNQDERKPEQDIQEEDEVADDEEESEEDGEGDESSLSNDGFPETVIQIPHCSGRSMLSMDKVLIASTALALSLGLYLSYTLRSQSEGL